MEAPTNLAECLKVSIRAHLSIMAIAEVYGIDAPEHEVESLVAESLVKCKSPREVLELASIAPSIQTMNRAINRALSHMDGGPAAGTVRLMARLYQRLITLDEVTERRAEQIRELVEHL